jgi:hypothetical protein
VIRLSYYESLIDEQNLIDEMVNEINNIIPHELIVEQYEWETGLFLKKINIGFTVFNKKADGNVQQLSECLNKREIICFLSGLLIAWKNPNRHLHLVKGGRGS